MKLRKAVVMAFLCAALAAVAMTAAGKPKIRADYDHSANFAAYKTFGFISPPGTEVDGYPAEITDAIKSATRHELETRGYRYVDAHPDLLVNFSARLAKGLAHDELANQTLGYYGYRKGNRVPVYKTWSTYTFADKTKDYVEGTINIDIVDSAASQLVWEGVAIGEIRKLGRSMTELKPGIDRVIGEIFEDYPFKAPK